MSPCGNFALIGSAKGTISMYNLQSGIDRGRFPAKLTPMEAKRLKMAKAQASSDFIGLDDSQKFSPGRGKHVGRVSGIQVDSLNKTVVSCAEDGLLKFWDFSSNQLVHEIDWSMTTLTGMRYHQPSDLIAVSCGDGYIRVVDISTRKLVRELNASFGLTKGVGRILDLCFSPDGKWIVAVSEDGVLRVWDLLTGHLIEALRFKSAPKALGFSPSGEFLATSHDDSVGVTIWTNRSLFARVSTRQIKPTDIVDVDTPHTAGDGAEGTLEAAFTEDEGVEDSNEVTAPSVGQLSKDLLTLSLVPKPRWQTLLNLDVIRQRNKPLEAPQKPVAAPFFLPSLESSSKTGVDKAGALALLAPESSPQDASSKSRISKIADPAVSHTSTFTSLLRARNHTGLVTHLSSLPPASADLAIRTLEPAPPYSEPVTFLDALTKRLKQRRDYELIQTWIAVFIKCHKELAMESEEVRMALGRWRDENRKVEEGFGEQVGFCRGVSGWVGGVV
jgi:U3 small nucleolar RNA-associated protein 21